MSFPRTTACELVEKLRTLDLRYVGVNVEDLRAILFNPSRWTQEDAQQDIRLIEEIVDLLDQFPQIRRTDSIDEDSWTLCDLHGFGCTRFGPSMCPCSQMVWEVLSLENIDEVGEKLQSIQEDLVSRVNAFTSFHECYRHTAEPLPALGLLLGLIKWEAGEWDYWVPSLKWSGEDELEHPLLLEACTEALELLCLLVQDAMDVVSQYIWSQGPSHNAMKYAWVHYWLYLDDGDVEESKTLATLGEVRQEVRRSMALRSVRPRVQDCRDAQVLAEPRAAFGSPAALIYTSYTYQTYQHLPTGLRNAGLLGPNRFQLVTCWRCW